MRLQGTGLLLASVLFLASATAGVAQADQARAANDPLPAVQTEPRAPAPASRLHPDACTSLCRMFEFLGALERPAPPKPIPTS